MIVAARQESLQRGRSVIPALAAVPAFLGFASMAAQILLMRELLVLFNGSEMSLGLMLAAWMLWISAGAMLGGIVARRTRRLARTCATAAILCGMILPLTLWLLRGARQFFTPIPTELLGPGSMILVAISYLSVFCILSGASFAIAARLLAQQKETAAPAALAYAYAWETAGAALGGAATSLVLTASPLPLQLAFLGSALYCCAAALTSASMTLRLAAVAGTLVVAMPAVLWIAPRMEANSLQRAWAGWGVVRTVDSPFGRITVTDAGGMRSLYVDGAIVANVPDPAAAEEAVHYALLEHATPRSVLLIGGTLNGSIAQALQYRTMERIDAVELDSAMLQTFREQFPEEYARSFSDSRVHVNSGDAARLLRTTSDRWDAIIVHAPEPQTAQWNRFYTEEFFRLAQGHLEPGGVLAVEVQSSGEFISPQRAMFLRCIYQTLKQAFEYVAVIPGGPVHMIASRQQSALTEDPQQLIVRLRARGLHTQYVSEFNLPFRMSAERVDAIRTLLNAPDHTPINRDLRPVGYYFSTVLWNAQFSRGYASLLERLARVPFWGVLALTALVLALIAAATGLRDSRKASRHAAAWSVVAGGYNLMTLEILLLFSLQSLLGYVYSALAVIVGMFMGGIALGTWLGIQIARKPGDLLLRLLLYMQVLAGATPLLLMGCIAVVHEANPVLVTSVPFAILALLCAVPGGMQFPVAAEMCARLPARPRNLMTIYALDLLGGCGGALLVAAFLVPLFGFWNTAWTAVIIAIPGLALALRALVSTGGVLPQTQAP